MAEAAWGQAKVLEEADKRSYAVGDISLGAIAVEPVDRKEWADVMTHLEAMRGKACIDTQGQ
eukprot:980746-Lingulodinium_polyedra.AAC.1